MPKWYDIGAHYMVILIQPLYKVCLILVVCCSWDNMIRSLKKKKKKKKEKKKKKKENNA